MCPLKAHINGHLDHRNSRYWHDLSDLVKTLTANVLGYIFNAGLSMILREK